MKVNTRESTVNSHPPGNKRVWIMNTRGGHQLEEFEEEEEGSMNMSKQV